MKEKDKGKKPERSDKRGHLDKHGDLDNMNKTEKGIN